MSTLRINQLGGDSAILENVQTMSDPASNSRTPEIRDLGYGIRADINDPQSVEIARNEIERIRKQQAARRDVERTGKVNLDPLVNVFGKAFGLSGLAFFGWKIYQNPSEGIIWILAILVWLIIWGFIAK